MDCKYCIDNLDFTVKVANIKSTCKYHKKKGAVYLPAAIGPKGLCRELFYVSYSGCLAVLYNGIPVRGGLRKKGLKKIFVSCPNPEGIKVEVRSEEVLPAPLRMLKEFAEEIFKIIYRPLNAPFRRVIIEVVEAGRGCPKAHKIGETFRFNTGRKDELCPAGFAAIYPHLRFLSSNGRASGLLSVHCPDYVGVIYELNRKQF